MHAVAVTRTRDLQLPDRGYRAPVRTHEGQPPDELVRFMAAIMGEDEADWRLRAQRPLPWIVRMEPDARGATARVAELRRHGLGAVSCDTVDARSWAPRQQATLVLDETELGFVEDPRRIAYADVRLAMLAMLDTETSTERVEHVRVSINARNAVQTMPVTHYQHEASRTRALFLMLSADEPLVCLAQGSVRLGTVWGAGGAVGRTSVELFQNATARVLERLPHAIRDDRLLTERRGRSSFSTHSDGVTHTASNVRETDLVARLMGLAWFSGQIDPLGG